MYILTDYDIFNLKELIKIRCESNSESNLEEALEEFISLSNIQLAENIKAMIKVSEEEYCTINTPSDKETVKNCNELIVKLLSNNNEVEKYKDSKTNNELENIHPDILQHIENLFENWNYSNAIEEAYKITRQRLVTVTWKEKANDAFNEANYEIIFWIIPSSESEKNFCNWVKFLHMAIQSFRNEMAHRPASKIEKNKAIHYIYLASLALYLINNDWKCSNVSEDV